MNKTENQGLNSGLQVVSQSPGTLVDVIKESINDLQHIDQERSPSGKSDGQLGKPSGASAITRTMRVTCSRTVRRPKQPDWIYPYSELPTNRQAYRGYPLDWSDGMKKGGFRIQICSPAVGDPTKPMAAFPPAVLIRESENGVPVYNPGELTGYPPVTEQMIANNTAGSSCVSDWYYAAGLEAPAYRVRKSDGDNLAKSISSSISGDI
eukprot:GHVP01028360.1.p1 GENE.GHVP01028360.1~~GHVP01028360.1.p1  ORF type:complete len:208 (+),score=27.27 GHVP01028360.1:61-684(+)